MSMNDKLYRECLNSSNRYNGKDKFWEDLAEKHGYKNAEKLRSNFRRERDRRERFAPQKSVNIDSHDVVLFDIETLPIQAYVWDTWKTDVNPAQVIQDWCILSWAAKDLMTGEVRSDILTSKEAIARDDKRIVVSLWDEFNEASILIGHNIVEFDQRKSNTRFLFHSLPPPAPYRTVDTLKILRYNFAFTYNRLDYINNQLGLTPKMDNDGFPLWIGCSEGNAESLALMEMYNKQDVLSEEELYLAVRAWDNRHPNIGLFYDDLDKHCKHCGSDKLELLSKPYCTNLGQYQAYRCKDCNAINRASKNLASKAKRESLLR